MFGIQEFGDGPGGPMVQGKWINRLNGQVINVRDSIINGDEMVIITDKGQISMLDFSRNYIQASSDIYDEHGNVIQTGEIDPSSVLMSKKPQSSLQVFSNSNQKNETLPITNSGVLAGDPEIDELIDDPIHTPLKNIVPSKEKEPINEKINLIKTIFEKNPSPEINLDILWTQFPKDEFKMLMNYFNVSQDEIAEFISDRIEKSAIVTAVNRFLDSKFIE